MDVERLGEDLHKLVIKNLILIKIN